MRLHILILVGLLFKGLVAEEVEVVEAVSDTEEMNEINKHAQDREDNEPNPDQIALESGDQEPGKGGGGYNQPPPPRGHLPPGRVGSGSHIGLQHPGKPYGVPHPNHNVAYHGPPPPLPHPPKQQQQQPQHQQPQHQQPQHQQPQQQAMDKYGQGGDLWPAPVPDMPKIISLDVKCEKNSMKVYLGFDKPFYGIVFSKGHYSNVNCVHLPAGLGRTSANFEISIHACGTAGNTENGLYGYGADSGSGTYFENIIVVQYDPQVQEVWDQARKLRCTWHDQYEKSVTFRPFPVDMLDVVRADFAGDNVGCWMQIQVGKGPWASEVSGLVKIGQTMTMVLAIKDDDSKFDMLVRNCMAHDGKRAPIQLVDQKGCVTRTKLMSRFTKIKNFGASASVLSYAHFQAFKFPDSMEVHFQCTIQICRYQCPDQCSTEPAGLGGPGGPGLLHGHHAGLLDLHLAGAAPDSAYGPPPPPSLNHPDFQYGPGNNQPRDERRVRRTRATDPEKEVGVNRVIRVVSTGDLTFSLDENGNTTAPTMVFSQREDAALSQGLICMTTPGFAATLVVLLAILVVSCLLSAFLCVRLRPFSSNHDKNVAAGFTNPAVPNKPKSKSCFYS